MWSSGEPSGSLPQHKFFSENEDRVKRALTQGYGIQSGHPASLHPNSIATKVKISPLTSRVSPRRVVLAPLCSPRPGTSETRVDAFFEEAREVSQLLWADVFV